MSRSADRSQTPDPMPPTLHGSTAQPDRRAQRLKMLSMRALTVAVCAVAVLCSPANISAQSVPSIQPAPSTLSGAQIAIARAEGRITIDGNLSDEGWQHATRIDRWYETQPGDNVEPKVKNVGYLTYDDRFLYAAFEFEDPHPAAIRAPFADRDNIGNGYNDYGGILLDAR